MAIIKCKMCGGDLTVVAGETIAECEYCGTQQTVPSMDNEKKLTLFSRANRLRFGCEFDKAAGIYETIVADFPEEAEAYWGLVLCKYGIEYVDDPATGKKIPTCHRSSFDSIMDDTNFEQACECADPLARRLYREEAKQIEEIRKGIIEVSGKEEPYDIFICYKETSELGDRTLDSVLAQDVYDALTAKGYRVFFSRITLEDKLGQEYDPYIFAALNSAKIMLAFGTDYEHFNAVWVKNEWSRYLQLMTQDKSKHLIPCYKGIDAYDMPKEFAKLQAQDMGKVGAVQDLLRGIEKILPKQLYSEVSAATQQVISGGPNVQALLKRGNMALEDGEWAKADKHFDQVLDMNAECAEAYLGKLLAELRCRNVEALKEKDNTFEEYSNYKKVLRFANDNLRMQMTNIIAYINNRNKNQKQQEAYDSALRMMRNAKSEEDYKAAAKSFQQVGGYSDAAEKAKECMHLASTIELARVYSEAKRLLASVCTDAQIDKALNLMQSIPDYLDAQEIIASARSQWEERKARFNLLVSSYTHLAEAKNIASQITDLEQQIRQWRDEKAKLENLQREFPVIAQTIADLQTALQQQSGKLSELEREHSSLGIFAGKKKKEIDAAMRPIQSEIAALKSKIDREKAKRARYPSENEVESKLRQINTAIAAAEEKIDVLNVPADVEVSGTEDGVIAELLSSNFIHMTVNAPRLWSELLHNPNVQAIIKENADIASEVYGVNLSKEMTDKLEGTDDKLYFVHRSDDRNENDLIEAFSQHYENGLFSGYDIRKAVAPEYFGAHRKCKPINFLFSKNGRDMLAVTIVKYSSISHPAVKNVKLACQNKGIKYLHFIVGYPNKEHYVVRRTLEELGEIPTMKK